MPRISRLVFLAAFALSLHAQQIAVWNDATKTYVAVKAGAGIVVDLTAKTISAPTPKPRIYGTVAQRAAAGNGWNVPVGAAPASLTIYVNGLRYTLGIDYTLTAGVITPINPAIMTADALVIADYDQI